jgi:hypothetical protein
LESFQKGRIEINRLFKLKNKEEALLSHLAGTNDFTGIT